MSENETSQVKLSYRQRAFVEVYLETWNATEAARQVGYAHPNKQGPRLLVNDGVSTFIEQRLNEMTLSADEVLARLSEQATTNISEFWLFENGIAKGLNLEALKAKGHLIKKLKVDPDKIEMELYDGQNALIQLGKYHKLFIDRIEHGTGDEPIQIKVTLDSDEI